MSGKHGMDVEIDERMRQKYDYDMESRAMSWISEVTGFSLGDDFYAALKDGVVLCELANELMPGSVRSFVENPKHYLECKANIDAYLMACVAMGVRSQDMFTQLDLSESKRDMGQVLQNIYAVARQAQAIGYPGPVLGVRYYKTRQDQENLERKKREEWEREKREREEYDAMLLENRLVAEEKKKQNRGIRVSQAKERMLARQDKRKESGRDVYLQALPNSTEIEEELDRSVSPVKYGLDAENEQVLHDKYDYQLESRLMDWMEDVTGYAMDDFYSNLRSGQLLCILMNNIRPQIIKTIHTKEFPLLERENIKFFLTACARLGVASSDLFDVNDLYDRHNLNQVLNCLYALTQVLEVSRWYAGPRLNDRKLDEVLNPTHPVKFLGKGLFFLQERPPPRAGKAFLYYVFAILLAFFSGFGNPVGSYPFWHTLLYLCPTNSTPPAPQPTNGTLSNGTVGYEPVPAASEVSQFCFSQSVATINSGVALLFLGIGGILLEYVGPKISITVGLLLKTIGCFLLGGLVSSYESVSTGLTFLDSGGYVILMSLMPTFQLYSHRPAAIFFSLVTSYCFGAAFFAFVAFLTAPSDLVDSFAPFHVEREITSFFFVMGGLYVILAGMAFVWCPLRKWVMSEIYGKPDDEEEDEEPEEELYLLGSNRKPLHFHKRENNDIYVGQASAMQPQVPWYRRFRSYLVSLDYLFLFFLGILLFFRSTYQWESIHRLYLTSNTINTDYPIMILVLTMVTMPFGLLIDWGSQKTLLATLNISLLVAAVSSVSFLYPIEWLSYLGVAVLSITYPILLSLLFLLSAKLNWESFGIFLAFIGIFSGFLYAPVLHLLTLNNFNDEWIRIASIILCSVLIFYPIVARKRSYLF